MSGRNPSWSGLRVLVVEDEMLVAMMIEEILDDHRCVVIGPFGRMPGALDVAQTAAIDLALLDVNLAGVKVYPVAEALAARSIPFLLLSGYGQNAIPYDRPAWRVCTKPFRSEELIRMMIEQVKPS